MPEEKFRRVAEGDSITTDDHNFLAAAVERLDAVAFGAAAQTFKNEPHSVFSALPQDRNIYVRMLSDSIPESSQEFQNNPPSPSAMNAILQVFDGTAAGLVDDPANTQFYVTTVGTLPLKQNDLVCVYYDPPSGKWLPVALQVTDIVRVTSTTPNAQGFYDGYVQIWNSDNNTWSDGILVYVKDANG